MVRWLCIEMLLRCTKQTWCDSRTQRHAWPLHPAPQTCEGDQLRQLVHSLCPSIFGHELVKVSGLSSLHGVCRVFRLITCGFNPSAGMPLACMPLLLSQLPAGKPPGSDCLASHPPCRAAAVGWSAVCAVPAVGVFPALPSHMLCLHCRAAGGLAAGSIWRCAQGTGGRGGDGTAWGRAHPHGKPKLPVLRLHALPGTAFEAVGSHFASCNAGSKAAA